MVIGDFQNGDLGDHVILKACLCHVFEMKFPDSEGRTEIKFTGRVWLTFNKKTAIYENIPVMGLYSILTYRKNNNEEYTEIG